jgi:hypothetical protein
MKSGCQLGGCEKRLAVRNRMLDKGGSRWVCSDALTSRTIIRIFFNVFVILIVNETIII